MPILDHRNVLKGLRVQEAMRRQVIRFPWEAPLDQAIRATIKYKVNAILAVDDTQVGLGVVSKTDLMGAYYAGLFIDTPVAAVMVGPPLFCRPEDSLDTALDFMRSNRVHRLYVTVETTSQIIGVLAYPDIVGLLYRYCTRCDQSLKGRNRPQAAPLDRFLVKDVMTPEVCALTEDDSLQAVMEALAAIVRYGGEEFAGIMPETSRKEGNGVGFVGRARESVQEAGVVFEDPAGRRRVLTISGGVATLPLQAQTGEELVEKADRALYRANARGRNCIVGA